MGINERQVIVLFVADNKSGHRFCSFEEDESFIRSLSQHNQLVCRDCHVLVKYRSGSKKSHIYDD
jgi:hypothetical protein